MSNSLAVRRSSDYSRLMQYSPLKALTEVWKLSNFDSSVRPADAAAPEVAFWH